jgi:hypothetical protein
MVQTPPITRTRQGQQAGRWRWYYASIADYRIAHPGCSNYDVAAHIGRHYNTVCAIIGSDIYREYEAQRMQAFRDDADQGIILRLNGLAIKALDSMDQGLTKRKDQVPLNLALEIATSTLDRLGFAPKTSPTVSVNVNTNQQNVVLPNAVSPAALEEARAALRAVEQRRLVDRMDHVLEVEAERVPSSAELEAPGEQDVAPVDS